MDHLSKDSQIQISDEFNRLAANADGEYDVGLANFYQQVRSAEAEIAAGADHERIEELIENINSVWPYFGQELSVSGKIYINDNETKESPHLDDGSPPDFVPSTWGSLRKDSWGYYCVVENAVIISDGFEYVGSNELDQEGYIAHAYTLEHSLDRKLFFARQHEQTGLVFPHPTLEGVTAQLETKFPALYSDVNKWVKPYTHNFNRLTKQLTFLVQKYPEICHDEQLATWLSLYLTNRVRFDSTTPYGITVRGAIEVVSESDAGDPDIYDLADPYSFDARIKAIGFSQPDEMTDYVGNHAYYLVSIPSGISEREECESSIAYIPTTSILEITPRRPVVSVAEQLKTARLHLAEQSLGESAIRLNALKIEGDPGVVARIAQERALQNYETSIQKFCSDMETMRAMEFATKETAYSIALTQAQKLTNIIRTHGSTVSPKFIVSGLGVQVPNISVQSESNDSSVCATIQSEAQLIRPSISIDIVGNIEDVLAGVDEKENGTYRPFVSLQLRLIDESHGIPLVRHPSGKPLAAAKITKSAIVYADNTTKIEVELLHTIRARNEAIDAVSRLKGAQKEKKLVSELREEISQEKEKELVSLNKLSLFSRLETLLASTKHQVILLDAIKGLICDERQVQVTGQAIDDSGKSLELKNHYVFSIDILMSTPSLPEVPCIAIRTFDNKSRYSSVSDQSPIIYLPLRNIKEFKF